MPTPSSTPAPETEPDPEEATELWGFPIDDTHDAFEIPTGGKMGTVLVTVEMREEEEDEYISTLSVWDTSNLETPIQRIETQGVTTHSYELLDANFDGHTDFCYAWFFGGKNNISGLYVWDEEQGKFVPTENVLGDLVIDEEKESICLFTNGAGVSGTAEIFRWENKEVIPARRIGLLYPETLEDGSIRQEIKVEEPTDGEWREIYREVYDTPDEIAAIMDAYYGGELLWYDLDYHGEEKETLWGFPIDDTHDAFEVSTGGKLGTVLVTVELVEVEGKILEEQHFSVWTSNDLINPLQTMMAEDVTCFKQRDIRDANFDGYMDFGYMYAMGNQPAYYHYWIWDEEQGLFVAEPEFDQISCPEFDEETGAISGWARNSCCSGIETYHRWEDGQLVCFRKVEITYPDENFYQEKVVYERIDGELVEVSREPYEMKG